MSGIAGINQSGRRDEVERMLNRLAHRGPEGRAIIEADGATLGVVYTKTQKASATILKEEQIAQDKAGPGQCAQARLEDNNLVLTRDPLGTAPLYYGWTEDGLLGFASEVKALLDVTREVHELPPGHHYDGNRLVRYFRLEKKPPVDDEPDVIAEELRRRLEASVKRHVRSDPMGSWLSGGLDSSTLAALARPHVKTLHTFAAGFPGASDLTFAREVARFIESDHHEVVIRFEDAMAVLPDVIGHLESFDALLVRSSVMNYLVAERAGDHVGNVLSGESGDELFAGYAYLKSLAAEELPQELIDITSRLHNTALQRVDRGAAAHGIVAHIGMLDPDVVDYALRIPAAYKIRNGVEKWILRRAMHQALPPCVLERTKAKFWEGASVGERFAQYAEANISDTDFGHERRLPNDWVLRSKEELMYYRIFRDHFGSLSNLNWMGRTKGPPPGAPA